MSAAPPGIETLISAHLDGELDDDAQRELDGWLAADPEHQRRFLRAVIEHRALRERFAAERARPSPLPRRRRTPSRFRPAVGMLVAAALAVAIAGAWWASRPPPLPPSPPTDAPTVVAVALPVLEQASGVSLVRGGARTAVAAPTTLRSGDRLVLDGDGAATLRYPDGTTVRIASGTDLTVGDSVAGKRLELTEGRIDAEMAPQPQGHPAVIVTAEAQVTVVGTTLAVARAGAETTAEVAHGRVTVTRRSDGASAAIASGECTAVAAGLPLAARPLGSPAGKTYAVGAGLAYATLDALPDLGPGDLVEIHAGTYHAARRWRASGTALRPIVIRGIGAAVIDGEGVDVGGVGEVPRALFQIEGDHCVVEDLSFVNARNGENGAGIRCLGARHTVIRRCTIARCDDGIMSGDDIDDLSITDSDVGWCGTDAHAGFSHGIYIGGGHAVVRGCHIHDTVRGQGLKSSCLRLELIENRITGADDGELSLVDAPGSDRPGSAVSLVGNLFAAKTDRQGNHRRFIEVGSEAGGMRGGTLTLTHNTCVAADPRTVFIDTERSAMRVIADGNLFVGSDRIALLGPGGLAGRGNWLPATAEAPPGLVGSAVGGDPGFVDPANGDFHLRAGSPVLGAAAGQPPGAFAPAP